MDPRRRLLLQALGGLGAGALCNASSSQSSEVMAKKIPSTGEALPVVGLGTWQTFDVGGDAATRALLREVLKVFQKGVLDSSPMYGSSESVAGDLIAELGLRDKLFIATKVYTSGREAGIQQMEISFKRLRVERMDLMQVHNLVDVGTHTKTLLDMKSRGKVRYIGITHYTYSAHAEIERLLKTRQYDFLQINYSLAERESDQRILALAKDLNVAVIANRPFADGALFRRVKGKALPPWAAELGIASWAQYFLKWIVSHPAVTCAIPGTGRADHMKDNLGAGQGVLLDESQRTKMSDYFDAL